MSSHFQGIFDYFCYKRAVRDEAGGEFDDFLIAALDAAFALPEVHYVSCTVANDLDFDVAEAVYCCFFGEDALRRALFNCSFHRGSEFLFIANQSDTTTTTSVYSLDHNRITNSCGKLLDIFDFVGGFLECWRYRDVA